MVESLTTLTIDYQSLDPFDPYALNGDAIHIFVPAKKPASKPADPAFENALRQSRMKIGLRFIGD